MLKSLERVLLVIRGKLEGEVNQCEHSKYHIRVAEGGVLLAQEKVAGVNT